MKYPLALRHLFIIAGTILILGSAYAEPPPTLFHASDIVQNISDTTTNRQRFVYVETGLLSTNDQIFLNLFEDVSFVATLARVEKLSKGGIAWIGHIDSVQKSEVTLISRGNQMAANIVLPGAFYQVRYAGEGVHVIKEIEQSKFPPEAPPIPVESSPSSEQWWGADADDGSSIDVLVVYTEAAKNTVGGQTAMENLIDLAVTETNTGYANSLVNQRLNLVHTAQVSYDETGFNWSQTLGRLRDTTDGYMDNVHTLRDAYQADEVVLIVDDAAYQYCGIGYLMTTVSQSFESSAFSVVRYSCATGYYSFGHELGHNMGSHHDRANASGSGAFDYSYGYQAPDKSFRTVMAYNCSGGCPRVNHWSNPNVDYNGQPTGIIDTSPQSAFNAKSLNDTAFTVANFRQSQSSKQTLTVTKSGSGTVTSSPAGIDCGTDCSEDYNSGTVVTLTATPDAGSIFIGWSGSCTGSSCSVTMDTNHTVNAHFETETDDLIIDFGPQYGIWAWMNNDTWTDIHSLSPINMVIGDIDDSGQDDIIIDFGSPNGIWLWKNNSTWVKLHSLSAESMTTGDTDGGGLADIIIDFGSSYGIWVKMNNSEWTQLHTLSPESMTTGDTDADGLADVIIDFGETYGIWLWMNNSSWVKLHTLSPNSMTTGDMDGGGLDEVIIDFGEPYGIWVRMNNSDWAQLHSLSPESMTTGDMDGNGLDDVIIDFGESYGIWVRMNNSSWVKLHSLSPNSMTTGYLDNNALADVIIDFGEPIGIWIRMNNSSWVKLHSISGEGMVTGNIDGLPSLSSNNITAQEIPAAELDNGEPLPEVEPMSLPTE